MPERGCAMSRGGEERAVDIKRVSQNTGQAGTQVSVFRLQNIGGGVLCGQMCGARWWLLTRSWECGTQKHWEGTQMGGWGPLLPLPARLPDFQRMTRRRRAAVSISSDKRIFLDAVPTFALRRGSKQEAVCRFLPKIWRKAA